MRRDELAELHYITATENLPSILTLGLLSHQQASKVSHRSVAMQEIQERRDGKRIFSTGRLLHEYVNLYFHARNPMMYKLYKRGLHQELCVVTISTDVLDIPGTIIMDRNASSNYARPYPSPMGLAVLDKSMVFAGSWIHPGDQIATWDHKAVKCAEVLVPDHVGAEHIMGAYVSCEQARKTLAQMVPSLAVTIDDHLFFLV